jgi:hypothetical protein
VYACVCMQVGEKEEILKISFRFLFSISFILFQLRLI